MKILLLNTINRISKLKDLNRWKQTFNITSNILKAKPQKVFLITTLII